ncbi:MAG: GtrA family protein, partial [Patescibacteria group bacterium]|nr:GtrA family protein [Patescibacteria group bacterium]
MNIEDIMDIKSIKSVLKNQEIYKFATVGIIGTPIVLLITAILTSMLGIFYAISAIIALEIWTIIGFFIHERWTFSSAPKNTNVINRMLKNNFFAFMG